MPFLLTDVFRSAQSRFAFKAELGPEGEKKKVLVDANGCDMTVWNINLDFDATQQDHTYLSKCHSSSFSAEISAMAAYQDEFGKTIVAVMGENQLVFYEVSLANFEYILYESLGNWSHQLDPLETDPILLTTSDNDNDYLIIHKFTGYITIINMGALFQAKSGEYTGARKYNLYNVSKSFHIGSIVVLSMAVLRRENRPALAVLYRDIDFNFSLRIYTFSSDFDDLFLERQVEWSVFKGMPSLVVAVPNGFMVASDAKLWFFASTDRGVRLAKDVGDSVFPVSYPWEFNLVILDMAVKKEEYLGMRFETSAQVDPNRILLVSDSGSTLLVYLETETSDMITTVTQFQVVDLGKSTVAADLVHVEDNVFYAGSTRSRSVFFQILPQHPHISIASCVTNSSPILNMNLQKNGKKTNLLLSRGGLHNGELEVVTDSRYKMKTQASAQVSIEANFFELLNNSEGSLLLVYDGSGESFDALEFPSLEKRALSNGTLKEKLHESGEVSGNWSIDDKRVIECTHSDGVLFTLRSEQETTISVKEIDQVSGLTWHKHSEFLEVYVISWSGVLVHIAFTDTTARIVETMPTRFQGKVSIACIPLTSSSYSIVLVDGNGLILDIPVFEKKQGRSRKSEWDTKKVNYLKAKGSCGPFKMKHSENMGALVFDDYALFHLHNDDSHNKLGLTKLHTFSRRVKFCQIVENTNSIPAIAALFEDGALSHFTFKNRRGNNDLFSSKHLILSSFAVSHRRTIALQLESRPNLETGQMDRVVSLLLFDSRTLELLYSYEQPPGYRYVDMCLVEKKHVTKKQNWVVVANSGDSPQEYLKVFEVASNKIRPVPDFKLYGEVPSSFDFSSISSNGNNVYLTGNDCIAVELVDPNASGPKTWKSKLIDYGNSSIFGAGLAGNDNIIVLADAVRGPLVSSTYEPKLYELHNPFKMGSSFATAITVLKNSPVFIYGDAEGQIWCAKKVASDSGESIHQTVPATDLKFETLFQAKFKDLINHILIVSEDPLVFLVATVKGDVFRIQDLAPYPLAQKHIESIHDDSMNGMTSTLEERVFRSAASGLFDARGAKLSSIYSGDISDEALKIELAELMSETRSL